MSHTDNTKDSKFSAFLRNPLAQGVATGLFTLIPARNYPRWLRKSLIWGPLAITTVGGAYLVMNPQSVESLSQKFGETQQPGETQDVEDAELVLEPETLGNMGSPTTIMVTSTVVGAAVSGSMAAALWADEMIERGLRRVKMPLPRVFMGVAAGVFTGWMVSKENQQDQ